MNHRWGKGDEKKESVCFVDLIEQDQWEAQDGSKRNKHRVFVEKFTFVGGGEKAPRTPEPEEEAKLEYSPEDDIPF